jgi:hypothetical protein
MYSAVGHVNWPLCDSFYVCKKKKKKKKRKKRKERVVVTEGMHKQTSLQKLTIVDCPILLQRYKSYNRDTGKDWAKIAHIRELDLR